jgi:hypothetical protein
MGDLYAALGIIVLASIGAFLFVFWVTQKGPRRVCDVLAATVIAALIYYTFYIWDEPVLARMVPYSSLIVLGNWYPISAAFLAGTLWNRSAGKARRKLLFVAALLLAAFLSVVRPLQGLPPVCEDRWSNTICLQSSPATCSPACAATLLGMHQIKATEGEMADLCLTREGTHWKGLYRGLKLKTADELWDVEFFRCSYDELLKMQKEMPRSPMILTVKYENEMAGQLSDGAKDGWLPGVSHSIVLVAFKSDGTISVADPTTGVENWTESDLKLLWEGEGMRLVERKR